MSERHMQHDLVGASAAMANVIRSIARAARTSFTVLIQGESGTGKELVAHAVHRNSPRCSRPFVAVNCAAVPESLLESEFFGYEKGAFTGAFMQKKGRFEQAAGGTLFLDEVGEISPSMQAKLLRALEERKIDRIGGTAPIPIDIRLIAATNRDLEDAIAQSDFREDLYYRLNVVSVRMPPLRERRKDIPALIQHFIAKYGNTGEPAVHGISPRAASILRRYDWPGNVRELQNVIQRAIVLGTTGVVQKADLPPGLIANAAKRSQIEIPSLRQAVLQTERQFVENIFALTNGDLKQAAAIMGRHPKSMRRFLVRLDLSHLEKSRTV